MKAPSGAASRPPKGLSRLEFDPLFGSERHWNGNRPRKKAKTEKVILYSSRTFGFGSLFLKKKIPFFIYFFQNQIFFFSKVERGWARLGAVEGDWERLGAVGRIWVALSSEFSEVCE